MRKDITRPTAILRMLTLSIIVTTILVMLSACGSAPKREKIGLQISASSDVNPDQQGRPSPIILHVLELNSEEQFNRLDYMSLTQSSGTALGPDLLGKTRLVLSPGDSQQLPLELNPQTTFLGLVAGYSNIDNATWRTSIAISQGKTDGLRISLGQKSITTNVKN
ncbi:MAG: type VI secretion system lipoprotein TssJ [Xanthomonadales bacterium]|nr:type VI secretion system lipoprotein TssJ [Xanthomonadales bacterium]